MRTSTVVCVMWLALAFLSPIWFAVGYAQQAGMPRSQVTVQNTEQGLAFLKLSLLEVPCGTAVSMIEDAVAENGLPADIYMDVYNGWEFQWIGPDGLLRLVVQNTSFDHTHEICMSRYIKQ